MEILSAIAILFLATCFVAFIVNMRQEVPAGYDKVFLFSISFVSAVVLIFSPAYFVLRYKYGG